MAEPRDSNSSVQKILDLERLILTMLCVSSSAGGRRELILSDLAGHEWRAPEHRVVYEALARMPSVGGDDFLAQLPAAATRMGFPDVEWNNYRGASEETQPGEIEELIQRLATACGERCGTS